MRSDTLRFRKNKGAAAVEFALVLPLLLIIIFGIMDFGRLFFVQISLNSATREAARVASLGKLKTSIDSWEKTTDFVDRAKKTGQTAAPGAYLMATFRTGNISIDIFDGSVDVKDGTGKVVAQICPESANLRGNETISVRAVTNFSWITPIGIIAGASGRQGQPPLIYAYGKMLCVG